jgi:hypothetical protein
MGPKELFKISLRLEPKIYGTEFTSPLLDGQKIYLPSRLQLLTPRSTSWWPTNSAKPTPLKIIETKPLG